MSNKIHVSANTWEKRSYPQVDQCSEVYKAGDRRHSILQKGANIASSFYTGERWLPPIVLEPGQFKEYIVELNLQAQGMSRDWSVGAWGENGTVSVVLPGRTSDSFPYVEINDSLLPITENGEE